MIRFSSLHFAGAAALVFPLVSSLAACSGADAEDGLDETSIETEDVPAVEGAPPHTAEEILEARERNTRQLEAAGALYTLQAGADHDIVFLDIEGSSAVIERIGPSAEAGETKLTTSDPVEIFRQYRPGEELPEVLSHLTGRSYPAFGATPAAAPATAPSDGAWADEDPGMALLPGPGLRPLHGSSSGSHFRSDTHNFSNGANTGCPHVNGETYFVCWLERHGGGYTQATSTHVVYHIALYEGASMLYSLWYNGKKKTDMTILRGEIWQFWWNGPWECTSFWCAFHGYEAVTFKAQWDGSNRGWHAGGTYSDFLRI